MAAAADADGGRHGGRTELGEALVGDSSLRITVPLPRSLNELKSAAQRHFRDHRGMYHHGRLPISHAHHVAGVQHNDVIVVARVEEPREAPPITTHAAHYVKHAIEVRAPRALPAAPEQSARFDGTTSYFKDFVKHPLEPRVTAKPAAASWERPSEPLGKSTYTQHYPWHDAQPASAAPKARDVQPSAPFEGITSYHADYIKHPLRPRSSAAPRERPIDTTPFDGTTTYNVDYKKYQAPRMPKHPGYGATLRPEPMPFEGLSEYTREYLKHAFEQQHVVHIEPEMRRPSSVGGRSRLQS